MRGLIIGGNSGIGEEFLKTTLDRDHDDWLFPTVEELDVRSSVEIERFVAAHGPFDKLVYSAGIDRLEWLGATDMSDVAEVFAVNVTGFISVVNAMVKFWSNTRVRVVLVGSDAAERPMRTSTAYCASKAAAHMAARVMARELGPDGWRINVVAPGMTDDTGMQEYVDARVPEIRGWSAEHAREYERSQEVVPGRIHKAEVAEVIWSTLRGPDHLNGSIITLNGGR